MVFTILRWLIDQYEPGTVLLGSTDTELDRTLLVRSVVTFLAIKAGIKLNPIRLYASSMAAAPELLKVVNLIMKAQLSIQKNADEKQYRKLAEIDIDDRVRRSSQSIFKENQYLSSVYSTDQGSPAGPRIIIRIDSNRSFTLRFIGQGK